MTQNKTARATNVAALLTATLVLGVSDTSHADTYAYDDLGRLTYVETGSGAALKTRTYTYDAAGNRTSVEAGVPNQPPVANGDFVNCIGATSCSVNIYPLDNDTDPNGDVLSIQSNTQTQYGNLYKVSPTQFLYQCPPAAACHTTGFDAFNYTISDGKGGTASSSVVISIF